MDDRGLAGWRRVAFYSAVAAAFGAGVVVAHQNPIWEIEYSALLAVLVLGTAIAVDVSHSAGRGQFPRRPTMPSDGRSLTYAVELAIMPLALSMVGGIAEAIAGGDPVVGAAGGAAGGTCAAAFLVLVDVFRDRL